MAWAGHDQSSGVEGDRGVLKVEMDPETQIRGRWRWELIREGNCARKLLSLRVETLREVA